MGKIKNLEMINISKSFKDIFANKNLSMEISSGEIVGLLGENGAGKTTLMNILYGLYQPDSGEIRINGTKIKIDSPLASIEHGIGMVHQHFMLIQNHSVLENIALAYKDTPFFFPKLKIKEKVIDFSKKFDFSINLSKKVWQLSAGEQQRIEIIKALMNGADLLILDEPTSVLTPGETEELFAILNDMKNRGHMIIFISHKLNEIMELCDRVLVMRRGELIGNSDIKKTDKKKLARMMIGKEVIFNIKREKIKKGRTILSVEAINVVDDKGIPALKDISFKIHGNEILGIAGVAGNGQRELAEAITGIRKIISGRVTIKGKDITNISPRKIFDSGVSHVPEERIKFGIAPGLFLYDNAILKQHHLDKYSRNSLLQYDKIKMHTEQLINKFNVSAPSINTEIRNLSGGNIQKLILGREISQEPSLLVASHPTYGLDVGATQYLRELLLTRRKLGSAVLLFSEDLDEIFELCDKIAVIFEGRFTAILDADDRRLSDIGLLMAGSLEYV